MPELQPSYYIRISELGLAQLDVSEYQEGYLITRIIVPRTMWRKGYGTALLKKICDVADKNHRTLYIQPLSYNTTAFPQRSLEEWYKKWGFKFYTPDLSIMRRFPAQALASEVNKERGMGWPSKD